MVHCNCLIFFWWLFQQPNTFLLGFLFQRGIRKCFLFFSSFCNQLEWSNLIVEDNNKKMISQALKFQNFSRPKYLFFFFIFIYLFIFFFFFIFYFLFFIFIFYFLFFFKKIMFLQCAADAKWEIIVNAAAPWRVSLPLTRLWVTIKLNTTESSLISWSSTWLSFYLKSLINKN